MDDFPKIDTEKNPRAVMYIHFAMDSETSNKCECNVHFSFRQKKFKTKINGADMEM